MEAEKISQEQITKQAWDLWRKLPDLIMEEVYEREIKEKLDQKIQNMNRKAKNRKRGAKKKEVVEESMSAESIKHLTNSNSSLGKKVDKINCSVESVPKKNKEDRDPEQTINTNNQDLSAANNFP